MLETSGEVAGRSLTRSVCWQLFLVYCSYNNLSVILLLEWSRTEQNRIEQNRAEYDAVTFSVTLADVHFYRLFIQSPFLSFFVTASDSDCYYGPRSV